MGSDFLALNKSLSRYQREQQKLASVSSPHFHKSARRKADNKLEKLSSAERKISRSLNSSLFSSVCEKIEKLKQRLEGDQ